MKRFTGTEAILERAFRIMDEAGDSQPVGTLAANVLQTTSEVIATRVIEPLLCSDSRFRVRAGRVTLNKAADPFDEEPVDELPLAVLDFETSGTGPGDRAIEIGLVCLKGRKVTGEFSTLLNPGIPVSSFVQRLTGIHQEDLTGKPAFEEVWPDLAALLDGRIMVAHNLPFDRRILHNELSLMGILERPPHAFCTLRFARKLFKKSQLGGLDALAHRFGFTFEARHRALDDARVAGRVFYRLLDLVREERELETWRDLKEYVAAAPRHRSAAVGGRGQGTGDRGAR